MDDLNRIRFLAGNYPSLQGLKYVPVGLIATLVALWANSMRKPATDLSLPLVIVLGGGALYFFVDRYYAHIFGSIRRSVATLRMEWLIQVIGSILALGAFAVDVSFELPVSTLGLVFSAVFLTDYLRITRFARDRFLLFYPFIVVGMIALSILPLFAPIEWWQAIGIRSPVLAILMIFGLVVTIVGLALHWFLVSSLPPARGVADG